MNPLSLITDRADKAGWNLDSQIEILCRFIDEQVVDDRKLETFLDARIAEETAMSEENEE